MKFQNLNLKQTEAVNHTNGPLLIIAGAGSGKTRTLTSRLVNLLDSGVKPENIIAITFTNKAAEEMKNRIKNQESRIKGGEINQNSKFITHNSLFIGTFHSLGARILRAEAKLLGRTAGFTIFDNDDSRSLVRKILKNFNFSEKEKQKNSPAKLEREFSKIKNELVYENKFSDREEIVALLFSEYEKKLKENNAFDFDDLIEKPVRIFQKYPEILAKYQNKFCHILVDEYQDTNMAQYVFVNLLAQKHKNLGVVGDDQQSIFGFRGSDLRNFLNFENDWPEVKIVLLEENYRSTSNIIEAASAVIANNKFQKPKKLWTQNSGGELVKIIEHADADAEAEWVAEKVSGVKRRASDGETRNPSVGILYRTNAQSRAMEQALIERGIPYKVFGGIRFYERKEIKDLMAALRWASNTKDLVSFERLEKSFGKKLSAVLKIELPQKASELKPIELVGYVLKKTDYFEYLERNFTNAFERVENVKEFIDFAGQSADLPSFLEKVSLFQPMDNLNQESKAVNQEGIINLMTVHLAKGLEFDDVYLLGANEGLIPHQMSYYSEAEIEEERRLMYVAMTRAKKRLILNFYSLPSRFLYEISPELVEFSGSKSLNDEERYIEL